MKLAALPGLIVVFAHSSAFAFDKLSVEELNFNMDKCFAQTQVEQNGRKRYCNKVIRSNLATRHNKAVALHNRAIINLNAGDKQSALADFETAANLSPRLQESLIAATQLRNIYIAQVKTRKQ